MLARALFATLLIVGAAFAGCLSKDEEAPDAVDQQKTTDNVIDANDSTSAPDGRGDISAFKETNKTEMGLGGMNHEHDYWAGRERVKIHSIPVGLIPFPLFPEGKPAGTAIADFDIPPRPEGDYLVFEGTKEVVLTMRNLTGPDGAPNPAVTVYFDYLTTADEPDAWRKGGQLKLDEPFTIPIAPTDADMPHQTKSLWIFRIYSGEPTWFECDIDIEVVKGYDVVNWPPHPDLYADRTERVLYDGPVHIESKGTIDANLYGTDANWQHPERIISYGTDRIEVTVTDVKISGQNGLPELPPQGYVLEFHNASKPPLMGNGAQFGGRLEDATTDGTTWKFVIDVSNDIQSYDTPYGQASRWGFRFVPYYEQDDGTICPKGTSGVEGFLQQFLVGCQFYPFALDYTIKIVAYGHSTAAEALPDAKPQEQEAGTA